LALLREIVNRVQEVCFYFVKRQNEHYLVKNRLCFPDCLNIQDWFVVVGDLWVGEDQVYNEADMAAAMSRLRSVGNGEAGRVKLVELGAFIWVLKDARFIGEGLKDVDGGLTRLVNLWNLVQQIIGKTGRPALMKSSELYVSDEFLGDIAGSLGVKSPWAKRW